MLPKHTTQLFSPAESVRLAIVLAGAGLAFAHQVCEVPAAVDFAFFLVLVVVVGIPHGAVDHLVDEQCLKNRHQNFSTFRFLLKYLVQMLAYAGLWLIFPGFSLLLFLLFSVWHFGESDMQPAPRHPIWSVVKFALGSLVLFFILLREPDLTGDLVYRITLSNPVAREVWTTAVIYQRPVILGLGVLLLCSFLLAQHREPVKHSGRGWLQFVVVLVVVSVLPLLPAFAVYFAGWHSLNTFQHMNEFLAAEGSDQSLWKKAMPFTLLAIVFLAGVALFWWNVFSHLDPLPVLFIFFAIITLPHLLIMHRMFRAKTVLQ